MFNFNGELSASKSWMNRALILQSWNKDIQIFGSSSAEDVTFLQKALNSFSSGGTKFDAGHGGTTFRFLALRVSRKPGQYFIKASPSLLKRPQQELIAFFKQVGVQARLNDQGLEIMSSGWKPPSGVVNVSTQDSSQFISAVLLSCAELEFALDIQLSQTMTSESYLLMTLDLLSQTCQHLQIKNQQIHIPRNLQVKRTQLSAELDISSAFSLAAAAVLAGEVTINNWPSESTQPDLVFLKIFNQMQIKYEISGPVFQIQQQDHFIGTEFNISLAPDLFPVLCALAAFAKTPSKFFGAPQLKHKESDRIKKTSELLRLCRVKHEALNDGMVISPGSVIVMAEPQQFDPADDHRMAMAAALFKLKKFPIELLQPETVNKSYPEFFQHLGLKDLRL